MNEDKYKKAKETVAKTLKKIKSKKPIQHFDLGKASYSEIRTGETIDGIPVSRIFLVLRGKGCEYAFKYDGCTMCGFSNAQDWEDRTPEQYAMQLRTELAKYEIGNYPILCLYNNGSFFNDDEITPEARVGLLEEIAKRPLSKLVVETRADTIDRDKILESKRILGDIDLEVALGLETSNDEIRDLCINKGLTCKDYESSADIIRNSGARLRTYILVKPPFLTEREAIDDAVESIIYAHEVLEADSIHIEVTTIQEHTIVSYLHKEGHFRTAWLWSIVEIINQTDPLPIYVTPFYYVASITDKPHNCDFCNDRVADAILNLYNPRYNRRAINGLDCLCKLEWRREIQTSSNIKPLPERIVYMLGEAE